MIESKVLEFFNTDLLDHGENLIQPTYCLIESMFTYYLISFYACTSWPQALLTT